MIDLMATHYVPVYSKGSGYLNENHEWVEGAESSTNIYCNIQPFREGKSKVILPDGVRTDSVIVMRSFTPIKVTDDKNNTTGDEIEWNGDRYECFREHDFSQYGLMSDHYKYLLKRVDI